MNLPSDSGPASVEESAAAEQQHYKDDDEQSGDVHFLSVCFWRAPPCVIHVHRTLVTNDGDAAPSRSGSRHSNVEANNGGGWCLFPFEHGKKRQINAASPMESAMPLNSKRAMGDVAKMSMPALC